MRARKAAALALTGAIAAGGAGVAIGATTADRGKAAEDAVIKDAAGRLGTSPEKLRQALSAAEDAQLDAAVKAGELTQAQADRIKQERATSGRVLGGVGGPPGGPGFGRGGFGFGPGRGFDGGLIDDVAKALGVTRAKLVEQLRAGKDIAAIAKAQGKTVDEVAAAAAATAKTRLDADVRAGKLTQAQADELLSQLRDRLEHLGERPRFAPPGALHEAKEDVLGAVAKALEMTPDALVDDLRSGKTLAAIAKAHNTTLAAVTDAAAAAAKADLDKAVSAGDLTQAEADAILERLRDAVQRFGDRPLGGPGFGDRPLGGPGFGDRPLGGPGFGHGHRGFGPGIP